MKKIILMLIAIVAMASNQINAQESKTPAGVQPVDTNKVDMKYFDLADKFGGKPWDANINKRGEAKGTVITGFSFGGLGGMNSYGGAVYGVFIKQYYGWSHLAINAQISEKMEVDKSFNQNFRSLGSNFDFAISLLHFGGKKKVNTTGMTEYQIQKAIRNEKYGRMWRLYAGPSVGYQYCMVADQTFVDPNPDVDEPGSLNIPLADGHSFKYGVVVGLERRFSGSITKVSIEGRCERYTYNNFGEKFNPIYQSVSLKIEFGTGRRPGGGTF